MHSQLTKRFAQVLIQHLSSKSKSTAKLYISEQPTFQDIGKGRIFLIAEINTPSRDNAKFLNLLVQDIERFYANNLENQMAEKDAFENALKQTNESLLNTLYQSSPLVGNLTPQAYIDKMNIIAGFIFGNQIVLAHRNAVGAFLLRKTNQGYKLVNIIDDDSEPVDGQLFSSVTEGQIEPLDYLFFANNDFLNFISKERIQKTLTSLDPTRAADYFKNSLLAHDGFNFSAIIVKIDQQQISSQPTSFSSALSSISNLNKQESKTEKLLSPTLLPNISSAFKKFGSNFSDKIKSSKITIPKISLPEKIIPKESVGNTFTKIKSSTSKIEASAHWQKFTSESRLFFNRISEKLNNIPHLSRILLGIFLICLLIFGYSIYFTKPQVFDFITSGGNKKSEELVKIENTLNEAESKIIYGDNAEAKRLLALAEADLAALKIDNTEQQAQAQTVSNKFNELVAKVRNITLIKEPILLISLNNPSSKITSLVLNGDELYIFDSGANSSSIINTRDKSQTPITGAWTGNLVNANQLDKDVYISTDTNNYYRVSNGALTPIRVALSASDKPSDFTFYNDRLYNLVPSANQIYRHPKEEQNFGGGVTWVQGASDLTKGVAIGIDTRIWVANSDGTVNLYFKGQQQPFALETIDPPLTSTSEMLKDENHEYIYLLDEVGNRVVVFDEKGKLKTQYFSGQLNKITSFSADESSKTLYLADGDKVYAAFMTHL